MSRRTYEFGCVDFVYRMPFVSEPSLEDDSEEFYEEETEEEEEDPDFFN